jgi:hypothetical protein
MKQIDVGQTITILVNIGVIAGIVFLGIEIQQNNAALEAQTGLTLSENRSDIWAQIRDSSELADLFVKLADGQQLTPSEKLRVLAHEYSFLVNMQWEYGETRSGRISIDQLPLIGWRGLVHNRSSIKLSSFMRDCEILKGLLDPEFVEFFDENVVNSPPE